MAEIDRREDTRAAYRNAIARAEAEGRPGKASVLTKALIELEARWAGECEHRRGTMRRQA